ncbi:1-phosphofructokinase family hexose kinase [soil metagenome]
MTRRILIASPNLSLDRTIAVESVALGRVHRSMISDARGGGKGVNVARALGCIGFGATVVGLAGGRTGDAVVGLLQDEGIDTVAVRCDGETRSCLTVLATAERITVFNESGPAVSSEEWDAFHAEVEARVDPDTLFVCSGSFPPEAPDDGAARLIDAARRKGCFTICDTSRAQLANVLGARPDIVTPNLAEARTVLEGSTEERIDEEGDALESAAAAAEALTQHGPKAALVTAGRAGAAVACNGDTMSWRAFPVSVLNPVGAGDCVVAGLASGIVSGQDLGAAAYRGLAMAAASCETFAAGLLDRHRYEELLA